MLLRKPPTITRALVEANRRNATRSTGPKSAAGKARARLNSLRHARRSKEYFSFVNALIMAPPYAVLRAPKSFLTPAQADHQAFVNFFHACWEAEMQMANGGLNAPATRQMTSEAGMSFRINKAFDRSHDVVDGA